MNAHGNFDCNEDLRRSAETQCWMRRYVVCTYVRVYVAFRNAPAQVFLHVIVASFPGLPHSFCSDMYVYVVTSCSATPGAYHTTASSLS